jgi:hypothetical protein
MAPKKAPKRKSEIRYMCDDPQYQYYPELRDLYCFPIATLEDSEDELEEE